MKKKLLILGIVLLTVVNISALAMIGYNRLCPLRGGHRENGHVGQDFLHRELALSEAQAAQMNVLKETFQSNIEPIRVALRTRREQLVQLLMAPEPDRLKIDAVRSEIDSLQAELQKQVINQLLAEKKILTEEQQQKFFSIIRERLVEEESHHQTNGFVPMGECEY